MSNPYPNRQRLLDFVKAMNIKKWPTGVAFNLNFGDSDGPDASMNWADVTTMGITVMTVEGAVHNDEFTEKQIKIDEAMRHECVRWNELEVLLTGIPIGRA